MVWLNTSTLVGPVVMHRRKSTMANGKMVYLFSPLLGWGRAPGCDLITFVQKSCVWQNCSNQSLLRHKSSSTSALNAPHDTVVVVAPRTTDRSHSDQPGAVIGLKILSGRHLEERQHRVYAPRTNHTASPLDSANFTTRIKSIMTASKGFYITQLDFTWSPAITRMFDRRA